MRWRLGVLGYGALFSIGLPLALVTWMQRLDTLLTLPKGGSPELGLALVAVGAAVMAAAVVALWTIGRGLPMSPFPPSRFVSRGVYGIVADPLYLGAVVACLGAAFAMGSGAGVWIVTPVLAMSSAAFVWGFEREQTITRFGPQPAPWLRLPLASDEPPDGRDRVSYWLLVLLPWLIMYEGVSRIGLHATGWLTYLPGEAQWPVVPWTESIYALTYPLILFAGLMAGRQRDLRRLSLRGLGATAGIGLFYLLVPLFAPYKAVPYGSVWTPLMLMERLSDQRACSLPSFHVLWTCLVAELIVATRPRLRVAAVLTCVAVGASCVTTGMHSLLDVLTGFIAYGLVARAHDIWLWLCRGAERIANSWREWPFGAVRVMSHGVYAAVGGAAGAGVAVCLAGPTNMWWVVGLTLGAEVGAGLWAQFVEGSPQLLRPYGYFGSAAAVILLAVVAALAGRDPWLLLAAMSTGGCVTSILGRLRCLVQGCCHGRRLDAAWGIRHTHPRSRVVRLSDLGGKPLHPTPLYSMCWTLVVFLVLLRLWSLAVPLPFVTGTYLALTGLGRFVEEHYRGEPQTRQIMGLRLYQWLAIAFVAGGAAVTCVSGAPTPLPSMPDALLWPTLAGIFVLTYVAYGVDFPRSSRRFSRLV